MRSILFFTLQFYSAVVFSAPELDRDGFVQALMQLRPGRNTQVEVERILSAPLHREVRRDQVVFAYRLNSKSGDPEYDVFLTFVEGLLVQVERPILDPRWSHSRMLQLYGRPDRLRELAASEILPRRTMFLYHGNSGRISRSFIRRNDTKKFISVIEYKKH